MVSRVSTDNTLQGWASRTEDRLEKKIDRINPGRSQDIRVVFSVPPDARGLKMEMSSGLFATETWRIALVLGS
jgi:hypothetical protein